MENQNMLGKKIPTFFIKLILAIFHTINLALAKPYFVFELNNSRIYQLLSMQNILVEYKFYKFVYSLFIAECL